MRSSNYVNVIGHISAGNFGDEMMLQGLLRGGRVDGKDVIVHRSHESDWLEPGRAELDIAFVSRYSLKAFRALALGPTFLCGGTTFHDANSGIGAVRQTLAMGLLLLRMTVSKVVGFENQAIAIGVGPVRRPLTRLAIRMLAQIARITVRDESSKLLLGQLGIAVDVEPDLAFSVRPVEGKTVGTLGPLLVLPCSPAQGGRISAARVAEVFEDDVFTEVRILALNRDGRYSDLEAALQLEADLTVIGIEVSLVSDVDSIDGVLSEIAAARLVIAGRFHALIAALVQEARVVAACYHEKMVNLASEFDVPDVSETDPNHESVLMPERRRLFEEVDLRAETASQPL